MAFTSGGVAASRDKLKTVNSLPRVGMVSSFRMSITPFLWLASSMLLLVFILVVVNSLDSMDIIMEKSVGVREKKLPAIIENQRSFINIESLRRIAEITYITDDPQKRRHARIDAQALAAESVFSDDQKFHVEALRMAGLIAKLASYSDAINEDKNRLLELSHEYYRSILNMAAYIPNMDVMQQVLHKYFDTTMKDVPLTMSENTRQPLVETLRSDADSLAFIKNHCETYAVLYSALGPVCSRMQSIAAEYGERRVILADNLENAERQWMVIDEGLREMRDNVGSDSEFVVTDALTSIENTIEDARRNSLLMFLAGTFFLGLYLLALHWFIVRPVRWTGQKLIEIQKGKLDGKMPPVRIAEMYNVAHLLDHFSGHLADLYLHASQLEEDVAEKRDLEALMRAVFHASLDGYVVWEVNRLLMVSEGVLRLLGVNSLEDIRTHRKELGMSSPEELVRIYNLVMETGMYRKVLNLRSLSGEDCPCEATYLPVQRQNRICILSSFRDMRAQKQTEEALRSAKEEAEAAAQEKSDFLARMSHEIRTPMNGVLGLTHLALGDSPPPGQQQYLKKIQASARILLRIINDILDFSKFESGHVILEHNPFSLSAMIATVMDLLREQTEEKGLTFRLETDNGIPPILVGDELRLSQVLLNLCGNAVKFTHHGEVSLQVELLSENDAGVVLRFTVSDTGVGMNMKQMESLFLPFAQADTSTTRRYGGTGLGLVISKLLVERMQGTIEVKSELDVGSVFSVTLPLEKGSNEHAVEYDRPRGAVTEEDIEMLRGKRVMLVEDNDINQEIGVALLEQLGMEVIVASNGAEAVGILGKEDVDIILMDIQMPVLDGLSAARIIREKGRHKMRQVPIIAMTAHAMWEDREKSLTAGMNDHITKPIDVNELTERLLRFLA